MHLHAAFIGQQHGRDQLESGGLSAAVRPEQNQHVARWSFQRNAIQRARLTGPLPAKPVEQRRAMAKHLAHGFEYDCRHVGVNDPGIVTAGASVL